MLGAAVGTDVDGAAVGTAVATIVYAVPPNVAMVSMSASLVSTVFTFPATVVPAAPLAARVPVHVIVKAPASMVASLSTVSVNGADEPAAVAVSVPLAPVHAAEPAVNMPALGLSQLKTICSPAVSCVAVVSTN